MHMYICIHYACTVHVHETLHYVIMVTECLRAILMIEISALTMCIYMYVYGHVCIQHTLCVWACMHTAHSPAYMYILLHTAPGINTDTYRYMYLSQTACRYMHIIYVCACMYLRDKAEHRLCVLLKYKMAIEELCCWWITW